MNAVDATLTASIVGIVVSGVVGPQVTAWMARRNDRLRFDRDQAAHRRDDLRAVLDEAAVLLAAGATNLRLHRAANVAGTSQEPAVKDWLASVFPLGQRLRLRLTADDPVVVAYDQVREALVDVAAEPRGDIDDLVEEFETRRSAFLDAARRGLSRVLVEEQGAA